MTEALVCYHSKFTMKNSIHDAFPTLDRYISSSFQDFLENVTSLTIS